MIQIRHANVNVECVQYIREGAWLYMKRDATQSTTSVCHTYLLVDYSVSICIYSKEEQCTFRLQVIYSREEQCPFRQQNGLQATGKMTLFRQGQLVQVVVELDAIGIALSYSIPSSSDVSTGSGMGSSKPIRVKLAPPRTT